MTLKEYLQDKELIGLEKYNNIIVNVFTDKEMIGLDVDTSDIPAFTQLTYTTNFVINEDTLKCGDIQLDLSEVNILS